MKISDNPVPSGSGGAGGHSGGHSGAHGGGDKSMPKDGRVMMAILKDMNITDYEPRVVEQLLEFVYRYISSVLEDARTLSNFARKKGNAPAAGGSAGGAANAGIQIDVEDVKLAVQMYTEHNLTSPPTRDILLEVATKKNSTQLPLPKTTGGLRLPPDRYCLTAVNYKLKPQKGGSSGGPSGGASGGGVGKRGPGKKTLAAQQAQAQLAAGGGSSFTMKPLGGAASAANIRINPLPTSSGAGPSGAPKFQIQAGPSSATSGGQPVFSMTVNPTALSSSGPMPTPGSKRTADQMDKS